MMFGLFKKKKKQFVEPVKENFTVECPVEVYKEMQQKTGGMDAKDIKNFVYSCNRPEMVIRVIDWLVNAERCVVVSVDKPGDGWCLDCSDKEYDADFLSQCKDIIRDDILNKIGQTEYAARLDKYEPDLANALREIEYYAARADYYEAAYNYNRSINDFNSLKKSVDYQKMWEDVKEKERIMNEKQSELIS